MRQKIRRFAAMAFIVAATACGGGSGPPASTASKPPLPAVTFQARLDSSDVSGDFDEVQLLIEFPPGAWTPVHSHGGPGLVTVIQGQVVRRTGGTDSTYRQGEGWIEDTGNVHQVGNVVEGQVTVRENGVERTFRAGESWIEPSGNIQQAGNLSGAPARVVSNYLVPQGAASRRSSSPEADGGTPVRQGSLRWSRNVANFDLRARDSARDLGHIGHVSGALAGGTLLALPLWGIAVVALLPWLPIYLTTFRWQRVHLTAPTPSSAP